MAKKTVYTLLNAVTGTGAGTAVTPIHNGGGHENLNAIIYGTFVGTVAIQGSLDGTNWVNLTSQTAPWAGKVNDFPYIRGNVSAYTSGSITVKIEY